MLLPEGTDYQPPMRLVMGPQCLLRLGELASDFARRRVLLVTDPGVKAAGHVARAVTSLEQAGLSVHVFDRVIENPTTREVAVCVEVAKSVKPELIVGLGGGSSMDTAKGCNFIYTNGGEMADYWGVGKASKAMLPLIAIPTTAGTGSECQSFALIADAKTHRKMACGDTKATPVVSVLDPVLTLTQPFAVAAATGIDALTHALESAVTQKRNAVSACYAREAFKLTVNSLRTVLESPDDLEARTRMQMGAAYAGLAIENSMLGAVHAAANPLTSHLKVTHGFAVGMMLPTLLRYNGEDPMVKSIYRDLALHAQLVDERASAEEALSAIIAKIRQILSQADVPFRQVAERLDRETIEILSVAAQKEWTGTFHPRAMNVATFSQLYRDTFASSA